MKNDLRLILGFIGACSLMLRLTFDLAFETREAVAEVREAQRITQDYVQLLIQRQTGIRSTVDYVGKRLEAHDESTTRQFSTQQIFLLDIRRDMQPAAEVEPVTR